MAKIKNVSGEDLNVPGLGGRLVLDGAVIEVPDEDTYSYTCQESNWAPADKGATKAHEAAVAATNSENTEG
jgi:hypothetical protein